MGLIKFAKDTKGELKFVNWPARQRVIAFTIVIIIVSIGVAAFLGAFDYIFSKLLSLIVQGA